MLINQEEKDKWTGKESPYRLRPFGPTPVPIGRRTVVVQGCRLCRQRRRSITAAPSPPSLPGAAVSPHMRGSRQIAGLTFAGLALPVRQPGPVNPRRSASTSRCLTQEGCHRLSPRGVRSRPAPSWAALCQRVRPGAAALCRRSRCTASRQARILRIASRPPAHRPGLPPMRPRARAAHNPALVRSAIKARSSWAATAPST